MKFSGMASVFLSASILGGCGQSTSPKNYDDCILSNMRGVSGDLAAAEIQTSCRKKFPEGSEFRFRERELKPIEILQLDGTARMHRYGNVYGGNIYNGNQKTTVTSITVKLTSRLNDDEVSREYRADVIIPPLTTGQFSFEVMPGADGAKYSWGIIGGKGFD